MPSPRETQTSWHRVTERLTAGLELPPAILASWERCRAFDIDPDRDAGVFRRVPAEDLERRLRDNARLVDVATHHLAWLSASLTVPHAAYVVDRDGIVLASRGDDAMIDAAHLTPGVDWSEATMGTNGAGTALASGQLVAVIGPQHYVRAWQDCTCTAAPIRDAGGAIVGAIDLSTSAADARPEYLALVAHVAYVIGQELRVDRALAQLEGHSDFVAVLGHELRNFLSPIRYAVQFLRAVGPRDARLEHARDLIDRQATQMARLLDDLLDLARAAKGKLTLETRPLDAATVVAHALEAVRPLIDGRKHVVTVTPPDDPVLVEGDFTRLAQVFINLLTNSAKYSEPGGSIRIAVQRRGSNAVVQVEDAGVGIAPEILPHVFDPFVQEVTGHDGNRGGLGIGLAVVRTIVEGHGGRIEAASDGHGRGSTFTVWLPTVVTSARSTEPASGGTTALATGTLRVLLVEDNPDALEALRTLVELQGHEVRTALTGLQAIELAQTWEVDVAFVDRALPGIDGDEVARRLRLLPTGRRSLLVALSGFARDADRDRAGEAGFDRYLVKPADPDTIAALLAEAGARAIRAPRDDTRRHGDDLPMRPAPHFAEL